jgi:hypothetical protein
VIECNVSDNRDHCQLLFTEAEAEEKTSENVVGAIFDNIAVP